ncbi:MAG TPA: c-type cytochrome biogenesis protein CcmI [Myxococcota bacterium]|nr:c-type cytochrome biogenesis protein CcmI [Myxococcota bacterium]
MTLFWALSALLAAAVVALVVWPLLSRRHEHAISARALNISVYKDQLRELEADLAGGTLAQADYERARDELEKRLLEDVPDAAPAQGARGGRGLAIAAAAGVPVLAFGIYLAVGNPSAVEDAGQAPVSQAEVEAMVERLAQRMEEKPDDVEGWTMLGRSYQVLGRYPEAAKAFARAAAREPDNPHLLTDLADALAMAAGQSMQGEPEKLVQRALKIDPDNLKALALAGTAAFERADYAGAAALWERMLAHVPPASEDAEMIRANVAEARSRIKEKDNIAAGLQGTVQLSPKLASRASPDDTVFVFARAAQGPAMPLAVLRRKVSDLPLEFSLDDSMAMTPAAKLSAHPRVVVGARISKSGNATAQPGDLQGLSAPVPNTAQAVAITIDTEVR